MALIKCPECGKEISDKASSCPNCGFPIAQKENVQEQAPIVQEIADVKPKDNIKNSADVPPKSQTSSNKKKGGCGTILWVLCGFALLGGWMEYTDKKKDDTGQSQTTIHSDNFQTTAKRVEPTEEPQSTPAQTNEVTVGSTFECDGLQITIDSANTDFWGYEGKELYEYPQTGMKYIAVSFTYRNVGNSDKVASIYDFDCYADNQACEERYAFDDSDFISTTLSSGRNVSFNTYYEVPIDAQSIELEYTANIWTGEKVIIILQ